MIPPPPPGSEEPDHGPTGSGSSSNSGILTVAAAAPKPMHDFDFVNDLLAEAPPVSPGGSSKSSTKAGPPPVPAASVPAKPAAAPQTSAATATKAAPAKSVTKSVADAKKPASEPKKNGMPVTAAVAPVAAAAVSAAKTETPEPAKTATAAAAPAPKEEPAITQPLSATVAAAATTAASVAVAAPAANEPAPTRTPAAATASQAPSLATSLLAQLQRLPTWAAYSVVALGGLILALGAMALILSFIAPPGGNNPVAQGNEKPAGPPLPPTPPNVKPPVDPAIADPAPPMPAPPQPMPAAPLPMGPTDPMPGPVSPPPMVPADPPAPLPAPVEPMAAPMPDPMPPEMPDVPETTPDEPPPRPPLTVVPVVARMRDRFTKIEFPPTPLVDFVNFATDFSTVPITLDLEGLRLAGASADSPITLAGEGLEVRAALQQAVAPLQLAIIESPQGIVITHRSLVADKPVAVPPYPLADLAKTPAEFEALRLAILRLALGERAEGAAVRLDGTNLVAELPMRDQWALLTVIERLRVARGHAPLTPYAKHAPALFKLESPAADESFLDQPVRIAIHQPIGFSQLLGRLRQATKIAFVADWPALHDVHWGPRSMANLVADEVPLRQALDDLTKPLGLAWTVAGDHTIQFTSRAHLAARQAEPTVEFHHVAPKSDTPDDVLRPIEQGLASAGVDLRLVELHFEKAGYIVARAPRSVQARIRQLASP